MGELTPAQYEAMETLTTSIAEKMLNDPIVFLKGKAGRSSLNMYLDLTKNLFNLDSNDTVPRDEESMRKREGKNGPE